MGIVSLINETSYDSSAQPRCVLGRHSDVFPDSELPVALKVCTIGGLERAMRPGMRNLK
jgi:hypothetical protein